MCGAETFPVHIPAAVRQMSAAEPESEHIRAAIRQMSMADSLPSRVPADIRRSSVAAGNAIRSSTRGKMSVSPDFSQPRRPETSHHAEQKQNFSPSTIPRDEPRRAPFKTGKRKVRIPWSSRELDALESGLDLLGWGQWMDIKKLNYNILKDRDNVAIKDKARNEALRRQKERIPLGPYCGCPFIADS
ncbi:hypothetical protein BGW37DRAFT_235019 [Umbelopsis sp. PMI_123]|nr:hypothetical protein BGW37DRAFT_235019 [Umbelopsis sp. PMI_123]